jgi:hypothetical protein
MSKKKTDPCDAYWAKLIGQAKVSLAGASDIGLKVQLIDTLQRFFDESNCWQESISFTIIPDTLDYPITPLCGRVLRLLAVLDQNNTPQPALMPEISIVRFVYPSTETQPMTAVVIKTLALPDLCYPPNIPEWLLPVHGMTILHGLLGDMMLQPGTSFSNPQMANYHTQKFRDGIAHARVAAVKMNTVGAQNWMFPQSHRVTGQKGGVSTFNVHPTAVLR